MTLPCRSWPLPSLKVPSAFVVAATASRLDATRAGDRLTAFRGASTTGAGRAMMDSFYWDHHHHHHQQQQQQQQSQYHYHHHLQHHQEHPPPLPPPQPHQHLQDQQLQRLDASADTVTAAVRQKDADNASDDSYLTSSHVSTYLYTSLVSYINSGVTMA